jgi:hypothetical protein
MKSNQRLGGRVSGFFVAFVLGVFGQVNPGGHQVAPVADGGG